MQTVIEQYEALVGCKKSLEVAKEVVGVTDTKEVLQAFDQQAQQVLKLLETQMYETMRAYVSNLPQVKVNKTTGRYYKNSAKALLGRVDTYGLISYTMGNHYDEVGFKHSDITFPLNTISPQHPDFEGYIFEGYIKRAIYAYTQQLKAVYSQLKKVTFETTDTMTQKADELQMRLGLKDVRRAEADLAGVIFRDAMMKVDTDGTFQTSLEDYQLFAQIGWSHGKTLHYHEEELDAVLTLMDSLAEDIARVAEAQDILAQKYMAGVQKLIAEGKLTKSRKREDGRPILNERTEYKRSRM